MINFFCRSEVDTRYVRLSLKRPSIDATQSSLRYVAIVRLIAALFGAITHCCRCCWYDWWIFHHAKSNLIDESNNGLRGAFSTSVYIRTESFWISIINCDWKCSIRSNYNFSRQFRENGNFSKTNFTSVASTRNGFTSNTQCCSTSTSFVWTAELQIQFRFCIVKVEKFEMLQSAQLKLCLMELGDSKTSSDRSTGSNWRLSEIKERFGIHRLSSLHIAHAQNSDAVAREERRTYQSEASLAPDTNRKYVNQALSVDAMRRVLSEMKGTAIELKLKIERNANFSISAQNIFSHVICGGTKGWNLRPHNALDELDEARDVRVHSIRARKSAELSERRDSDNVVHAVGLFHNNLGMGWGRVSNGEKTFAIFSAELQRKHFSKLTSGVSVTTWLFVQESCFSSHRRQSVWRMFNEGSEKGEGCHCIMYRPEVVLLHNATMM